MSDGWEKIETAPKDGTSFWAWSPSVNGPFIAEYWKSKCSGYEGFGRRGYGQCDGTFNTNITHWTALNTPTDSPNA